MIVYRACDVTAPRPHIASPPPHLQRWTHHAPLDNDSPLCLPMLALLAASGPFTPFPSSADITPATIRSLSSPPHEHIELQY